MLPRRSISDGSAARATRNALSRFALITARQLSGVCSSTVPGSAIPALSTTQSRPPSAASARETTSCACAGSPQSPASASAPVSRRERLERLRRGGR